MELLDIEIENKNLDGFSKTKVCLILDPRAVVCYRCNRNKKHTKIFTTQPSIGLMIRTMQSFGVHNVA